MDLLFKSIENWPRMVAGQHIRIKPIEGSKKKVPDNWRKVPPVYVTFCPLDGNLREGRVSFSVSGPPKPLGGSIGPYRGL